MIWQRLLFAWKCVEPMLLIAWKCTELRPSNEWKCTEPRLAWECELRGRLRTAARVRRMRVGSAREVLPKCGSNAWNRGPTHWWVPYWYGTGTLRVKVQAVVQCYTKDFNLVSWIQNFVVDRKGNGHPAVPGQHYALKFIRVGNHMVFM